MMIEQLSGQLGFDGIDPLQSTEFNVRKRDGKSVLFDETRVYLAIESAFKGERGLRRDDTLDETTLGCVQRLTESVVQNCLSRALKGESLDVERVQDAVETQLMIEGHHGVARHYIVYREDRKKARALKGLRDAEGRLQAELFVTLPNGLRERLDPRRIEKRLIAVCQGLEGTCSTARLTQDTLERVYDGIRADEIEAAMLIAAKSRMKREPDYSQVAARLLLRQIYRESAPREDDGSDFQETRKAIFQDYVVGGIRNRRLAPELAQFDLEKLAEALRFDRDSLFSYGGLQELRNQCLMKEEDRCVEPPQFCWMRVAMGLAIHEGEQRDARAIEFYEHLSTFRFLPSVEILRYAGTPRPQLSSSHLLTTTNDLDDVFQVISENARLLRQDAELANDWTNMGAAGSQLNDQNGRSQGVIPFVKLANGTAAAVNPGGKRDPSVCAYLETWHLDIGDFLELGKSTFEERETGQRLTTAHWIPDLFMKRVIRNGPWTLFSPTDVPDLHELFGAAFEKRYEEYEAMADRGEIKLFMRVEALPLWHRMLATLFDNGRPWITFKDPANVRSTQNHAGVVHCGSLRGDVFLNTATANASACVLGSLNLAAHVHSTTTGFADFISTEYLTEFETRPPPTGGLPERGFSDGEINKPMLIDTIRSAMRMLDNATDLNLAPPQAAERAQLRDRPVGLGLMGFQDALYRSRIAYASEKAVRFADRTMELISYHAILASSELAEERGVCDGFAGSHWAQGLLPIDTLAELDKERGGFLNSDKSTREDWSLVRAQVRSHGMRNSACLAITEAPELALIAGVSPSIEPEIQTQTRSNDPFHSPGTLSPYLVHDLKRLGLWDDELVEDVNRFNGSILRIERIPSELRELYRTGFEIDPKWLIECASRRQKWIDMGQSLNLYLAEPNGKRLHEIYLHAWQAGLKSTLRLKSLPPRRIDKSRQELKHRVANPGNPVRPQRQESMEPQASPVSSIATASLIPAG